MASTFLTRTAGSAVAAERKKYTISVWVKRSTVGVEHAVCSAGNGGGSEEFTIRFDSTDKLNCFHYNGSSMVGQLITNRLFRDVNAWYHIYFVYDSANSTQADRFMLYINGERETSFSTNTGLTQNDLSPWNVDERHQIGSNSWANSGNGNGIFDGVMSHFYNVAGSHIAVTQFGSTDATTGEWKINTNPTISSYGTDGFLVLKDGNTATDQSPNSNNFTITGTLTKTEDNPSNVFCTLSPLHKLGTNTGTYSNGNTKYADANSNWQGTMCTLGATSGKYYWEYQLVAGTYHMIGVMPDNVNLTSSSVFDTIGGYSAYLDNGTIEARYNNADISGWSKSDLGNTTFSTNDYINLAVDMDNKFMYIGKNGTWLKSGNPTSGSSGTGGINVSATFTSGVFMIPVISAYNGTTGQFNFGNGYMGTTAVSSAGTNASNNGIFEYDVPTGYTALSTKGLNL